MIETLENILAELKEKTEDYVSHEKLTQNNSEDFLLMIAIQKYLDRYK